MQFQLSFMYFDEAITRSNIPIQKKSVFFPKISIGRLIILYEQAEVELLK